MSDATEPTPEQIKEALDELAMQDRIRTAQSCLGGCLKWTLILFSIVDLFFVNIAIALLLYKNLGL